MAWIAGCLVVLVSILLIGVVALLHNNSFRQYLLRIAHTKLSEAVGIELKMRDFSVHLSGLSPAVDMYDVVIDGAPPYTTPPLLQVDHLSVGIQIVSLLSRKWYLKDIVIDHPVARCPRHRKWRYQSPENKKQRTRVRACSISVSATSCSGMARFTTTIKRVRSTPTCMSFEFQSSFDPGPKRYSGGLGYQTARSISRI